MLHEERTDVSDEDPADLRTEYLAELRAVIEDVGVDETVERTGVDREVIEAIADGESPTVDFEDAAAVQALAEDAPDAESIVLEATDHLLLGMSMAVLDVDAIAADVDLDYSPKEIQQKLERRAPMTLAEFATLEHYIASRR